MDIEFAHTLSTCRAAIAAHIHRQTLIIPDIAFIVADFIAGDMIIDNVMINTSHQLPHTGVKWSIQSNTDTAILLIEHVYSPQIGTVSLDKMTFINACIATKMLHELEQHCVLILTKNLCQYVANDVKLMLVSSMSRIKSALDA